MRQYGGASESPRHCCMYGGRRRVKPFFKSGLYQQRRMCYNTDMDELDTVLRALRTIRAPRTVSEYDLHALVTQALTASGLVCQHEAPVAPRRRIDVLCGAIGVEVKRGRPAPTALMRQLEAYAASGRIAALVLVAERPPRLPQTVGGKPLRAVSLQRLWGIAL